MVIDEDTSEEPGIVDKPKLSGSSKPKLQPGNVSQDEAPVKKEAEPISEPEPEPVAEADTKKEPEPGPDKEDKAEIKTKDQAAAEIEDEAAKQAEHDANIQKIVDSKKYFLPINSVEKRRSARFVALGIVLSLLLAVAWVDVALDAGLIHLGNVKPVTHFFSN
jgi:outer membrane biosynthesis protein TonB